MGFQMLVKCILVTGSSRVFGFAVAPGAVCGSLSTGVIARSVLPAVGVAEAAAFLTSLFTSTK